MLIVDDNAVFARTLIRLLEAAGLVARWANHAARVPEALAEGEYAAAVVEAVLPGTQGLRVLEHILQGSPRTRVIMLAATASLETAVMAMRLGAVDFRLKPVSPELLAEELRGLVGASAPAPPAEPIDPGVPILGDCPALRAVVALIDRLAVTDAAVLVSGESGTGKELVARAIHARSARRGRLFLAVNCGALSEGLIDSELFGHARGAFTGATASRRGLFEEASGGSILLDEIASTGAAFQARLLRVIEDGEVRPVGQSSSIKTDVRILASTNVDLRELVAAGRFRADLYYRLNVVGIELPPLRERGGDIELLARHFARQAARTLGRPEPRLEDAALAALLAHRWPGNVRELRNVVERAVVVSEPGLLRVGALGLGVETRDEAVAGEGLAAERLPVYAAAKRAALELFTREYVQALLSLHGGNISRAAKAARVPRQTLHRLLRQLNRMSR